MICSGIDGICGRAPLFMDVTIVSPVHGTGAPMPRSRDHDGAAVDRAEKDCKEKDYPDVFSSPHAALLSLGTETYGRWSKQSLTLIRDLARYKASNAPEYLQKSLEHACSSRWWNLLAVSVQKIVCESILRPNGSDLLEAAATLRSPALEDILDGCR